MTGINRKYPLVGNAVSLFSGAGGLDIGFHRAGYNIIWANDIDKNATQTYASIFPNHDIKTGNLLDQTLPESNKVDVVIGGPPCQGFSVAGKMDPKDPRSQHVWNFMAVVYKLKPKLFVMENVKALAINRRWEILRSNLKKEAQKMGYKTELFLLNSADYGVPQARERMFLIGFQVDSIKKPRKVTTQYSVSLRKALNTIPSYGESGNDGVCSAKITPAKNPILRKSPYAGMLFNGQGRPLNLEMPALTLPASMGGNRTPIIDQLAFEDEKETPWVVDYHSYLCKGGKPHKETPDYLRRITVEEAAVIQTFPKEVKFKGSQSSKYCQIGNAVPPELAFNLAKSLRTAV